MIRLWWRNRLLYLAAWADRAKTAKSQLAFAKLPLSAISFAKVEGSMNVSLECSVEAATRLEAIGLKGSSNNGLAENLYFSVLLL